MGSRNDEFTNSWHNETEHNDPVVVLVVVLVLLLLLLRLLLLLTIVIELRKNLASLEQAACREESDLRTKVTCLARGN